MTEGSSELHVVVLSVPDNLPFLYKSESQGSCMFLDMLKYHSFLLTDNYYVMGLFFEMFGSEIHLLNTGMFSPESVTARPLHFRDQSGLDIWNGG